MNQNQTELLFTQIANESDGLFTAADIQYFFEVVVPNLDESDEDGSFINCYKIALEMRYHDLETIVYSYGSDYVKAISYLTHDTAVYRLTRESDCAELAKLYPDDEDTIGVILKSNADDYAKTWLLKQHEPSCTRLHYLKYDSIAAFLDMNYEYDAKKFLQVYDGIISKAILQRNLQEKLVEKGTKSKSTKI